MFADLLAVVYSGIGRLSVFCIILRWNERVPKIIVNDTISLFLELQ